MLLIRIFVELRVVAGKSRTRAGSPQAVSRRPCCAVALRRTAWSEYGMGAAWAWQVWIRHGRTVQIKWERHIPNPSRHGMAGERHERGMGTACYVWIGLKCLRVIGNHPRRTPLPTSHLHNSRNVEPIPVLIHHLTDKCFAHRPLHPKPPSPTNTELYSCRRD